LSLATCSGSISGSVSRASVNVNRFMNPGPSIAINRRHEGEGFAGVSAELSAHREAVTRSP